VFANLGRALAAAGAGPRHVAKITIYVAGHRHECPPAIDAARAGLFADHKPAVTVMGVKTLARPEYLIDVPAIAVIDR
jgi:enamine deaminase RidA (YjgF/YER057c/UK114 family)